jgi:hypothetical protein
VSGRRRECDAVSACTAPGRTSRKKQSIGHTPVPCVDMNTWYASLGGHPKTATDRHRSNRQCDECVSLSTSKAGQSSSTTSRRSARTRLLLRWTRPRRWSSPVRVLPDECLPRRLKRELVASTEDCSRDGRATNRMTNGSLRRELIPISGRDSLSEVLAQER